MHTKYHLLGEEYTIDAFLFLIGSTSRGNHNFVLWIQLTYYEACWKHENYYFRMFLKSTKHLPAPAICPFAAATACLYL